MIERKEGINWIDSVGIGAFMFFAILQLSRLFELLINHFFIIIEIDPEIVLWMPEVLGVFILGMITLMVVMTLNKRTNIISRKNLKNALAIFFVVGVIQTCYSVFGYEFMHNMFPERFDAYYEAISEKYLIRGYVGLLGLLKYFVFGLILYWKRDDVIGEKEKPANQISDIGNS